MPLMPECWVAGVFSSFQAMTMIRPTNGAQYPSEKEKEEKGN